MPRPSLSSTSTLASLDADERQPSAAATATTTKRLRRLHQLQRVAVVEARQDRRHSHRTAFVLELQVKPRGRQSWPATAARGGGIVGIGNGRGDPTATLAKRLCDFTALRKCLRQALVVSGCVSRSTGGECAYCDAFATYFACRSMQPAWWVQFTKPLDERRLLVEDFINQCLRLAVMARVDLVLRSSTTASTTTIGNSNSNNTPRSSGPEGDRHRSTESKPRHCRAKELIPAILDDFFFPQEHVSGIPEDPQH